MRAFLTGGSGFVGTWLERHLAESGDEIAQLPLEVDISCAEDLERRLSDFRPDVIYHLAALTHVGRSWDAPAETFTVNALGTLGLLEVARRLTDRPRVVLVSSAEVYGAGDGSAISEKAPLLPVTPYAASKVAAEYIGLQQFLGRGLEVIRARPFNHIGPGQADSFVVSALARRIVEAECSGVSEIRVGNLDAARDFTDVRDVVRAYRLLAIHGIPGEVYNICSESAVKISTILGELLERSSAKITAVADPELFRPVDVPVVVGDCSALKVLTNWQTIIDRKRTIDDVLASWRERLQTGVSEKK